MKKNINLDFDNNPSIVEIEQVLLKNFLSVEQNNSELIISNLNEVAWLAFSTNKNINITFSSESSNNYIILILNIISNLGNYIFTTACYFETNDISKVKKILTKSIFNLEKDYYTLLSEIKLVDNLDRKNIREILMNISNDFLEISDCKFLLYVKHITIELELNKNIFSLDLINFDETKYNYLELIDFLEKLCSNNYLLSMTIDGSFSSTDINLFNVPNLEFLG